MKVLKAYKYRLYPTPEQETFIKKTFSCVRLVYNLLLQDRIALYKQLKKEPSLKVKMPTPAKYKAEYPKLREVDSLALANAQGYLDRAFKNFHRGNSAGFPKLKAKHSVRSYTTNNQRGTVRIVDNHYLKVPKLKTTLKMAVHRPLIGKIKSATISMSPSEKYFVSILCEQDVQSKPKTKAVVGITLGKKTFAVLSNGQTFDNDKCTQSFKKRLIVEEKKLRRRKEMAHSKGLELSLCKNYQKQKTKVAKMREKLMNQRTDFLNKITTNLVAQYDIICIEDLGKKDFLRNTKLNKGISDVSWSLFVSKLEYKALWYDKKVIRVAPCELSELRDETEKSELLKSRNILTKGLKILVE